MWKREAEQDGVKLVAMLHLSVYIRNVSYADKDIL